METRVETRKFAELRAKTDRQLLVLVRREMRAARAAAGAASAVHPNLRARAEAALATAASMLPKVYGLDDRQRAELQAELEDLRGELEEDQFQTACAVRCA